MPGSVKYKPINVGEIMAKHKALIQPVIIDTAKTILAVSNGQIPVDTGSAQASGYVIGPGIDTYEQAVSTAEGLNPHVQILEKIDAPSGDLTAYVSYAASHEPILELGGHGQAARPHLTPAAEGQRGAWEAALRDALGRL